MELEPSANITPVPDAHAKMPEPPPVKLVAVDDIHIPAELGHEAPLDRFYITLLRFELDSFTATSRVYRAENFRLCFDLLPPPIDRIDYRPIMIEVPSLAETERKLIESEIEYTREKTTTPGRQSLLLLDPAGNYVELTESRRI